MNRNRKIKQIAAGVLSLSLALTPSIQALAAEKEENVYGTLENDGSVSGIYGLIKKYRRKPRSVRHEN